jgi:septum formation protein
VVPRALRLVLASASPQRKEILDQLGVAFTVRPADVEELEDGPPEFVVLENARRKVDAVPGEFVLGCDTEVFLDGEVFGKAEDEAQAERHLRRLSGRTHQVYSGIALRGPDGERAGVAVTDVTFRALSDAEIEWYLATGEWRDRAGAYAIQGRGSALVERIDGDFWNVVGLPVPKLLELAPELATSGGKQG